MNAIRQLVTCTAALLLVLLGGCANTAARAPEIDPGPPPAAALKPLVPMRAVQAAPLQAPGPATSPSQPLAQSQVTSQVVAPLLAPADLWERIRRGFAMPDLQSPLVTDREQWYATRPDYMVRMTERSSKYLFHIVEELESNT